MVPVYLSRKDASTDMQHDPRHHVISRDLDLRSNSDIQSLRSTCRYTFRRLSKQAYIRFDLTESITLNRFIFPQKLTKSIGFKIQVSWLVTESIDCHWEGDWVDRLCVTHLTESIKPLKKVFSKKKGAKIYIHEARQARNTWKQTFKSYHWKTGHVVSTCIKLFI